MDDEYRDDSTTIYAVMARIFVALAILATVGAFLMGVAIVLGMAGL